MKKILLSGFLLGFGLSFGQWTTNYDVNTLVADVTTSDIQSIGTNDGKTFVIFWDEPAGYDLRVQILDKEGNQLLGANGILANAVADNSTWTATRSNAVDAEGNLYIGFTATGDGNGYVNKISPTGEQLFGANGIAIPEAWDLKILGLADGSAVVGWTKEGMAQIMKYDNEGNDAWETALTFNSPDSGRPFTGAGEFIALSDGSIIGIFHTKTTSWNTQSIPYAQKYSAEGEAIWTNPIQVSTQTLASNRKYEVLQQDDVTYFGYYGSTGWRFDSYIQRINADGTMPWGVDGADFSTNEEFLEMETSIVMEEGSDFIWSRSNFSNANQSQFGLYVQKFDKATGERQLGDSGKAVFVVNSQNYIGVGNLQIVESQPLLLFSNGISDGVNSIQLGVSLLNEEGEFVWENDYEMIATSTGNKFRYDFTQNVDGQSVAVWSENRNGTNKAYAQNILVEIETAGTTDFNQTQHRIYPNPTKGILNIQSKETILKIEVYDLNGRLIQTAKDSHTIQLNALPKGNYVVKSIDSKGNTQTSKVVKN